MTAKAASGQTPLTGAKNRLQSDDDRARLVIDENGRLVYVSDLFAALINQPADKVRGQLFASFLEFANPEEALDPRSLFGTFGPETSMINEGVHRAMLTGHAEPAFVLMQFDRVVTREGHAYTIGAEITNQQDNTDSSVFTDHVLRLIEAGNAKAAHASVAAHPDEKIGPGTDEGELRHFLDMSNDLLAVSNRDGLFLRANGRLNETIGYSDNELRRMTFMDLIYPEDRGPVRSSLVRLMREETGDGQIIDFEARIVAKSGRILSTEWRQKRSGALLYSVGRDVTAIKEQEAALHLQQTQLDEAQALGHMGHWRWVVGSDDIVWSDELYNIFGVTPENFRPALETVNAMLHRRDVGRMLQAFQRAIIEHANYEMDCRIVRPSGDVRTLRCEGKCEEDANGEVIALFGIMQDITQRVRAESDLRNALEAAERAYAAKSQFLANMSHELRTPLNAIIGFSEMMQRQLLGPIGTPRYLDYITGIRESGEHLLDLISDILDMSKIEAGKYELDLEEFNVGKIIKLAAHMMEGRAQDAAVHLNADIQSADQHIIADRRGVMQILLNLMSNAVKFTEPGGTVTVDCHTQEKNIVIRVQDTGIGIPANQIAYITRPFEQAASQYTRRHEGTGLGLAITKDLTELHGGTLQIESTEKVGTTVTITLPLDARPHIKPRKKSRN